MQPVQLDHDVPTMQPQLFVDEAVDQVPIVPAQHGAAAPEECYDRIAQLAAALCATPYAFVDFLDQDGPSCRAMYTTEETHVPEQRRATFHDLTIEASDVLVVEDATTDRRFAGDPALVGEPHLPFWAGAAIRSGDGFAIGVLGVADSHPRQLEQGQIEGLRELATLLSARIQHSRAAASYRQLFLKHPVPMWISDEQSLRILAVNDCAVERYGYSREQFLSLRITDLRPPTDVPDFLRHLSTVQPQGRTGPFRHVRDDGSLLYVEISHQPVVYERRPAQLVMAHDVTEKVTWKRAHQVTEERFSLLVDSVEGYAIVLLDPVGRVISWNRGAHRLYGFGEREAVARSAVDFFPENEDAREAYAERLRDGTRTGAFQIEAQQVRADGSTFWADVLLTPILDERGRSLGFVQITHDVSLRRDHERRLIEERERAEHLNEISSRHLINVSRDLRTPLTSILGAAEVLGAEVDAELTPFADSVRTNGEYLLETIETALEYVQLTGVQEDLPLETVDLRAQALAAVDRLGPRAAELGLSLETDLPPYPVSALAHTDVLERVLGQLIRNGLKYTSEGTVTVRATSDEQGPLIEVEDTGIGMSDAFLARVFEPFAQENPDYGRPHSGCGLGLPTVQRQVERMGGRISVWSEKDSGSRFTIRLLETEQAA